MPELTASIINDTAAIMYIDGKSYTVERTSPQFEEVKQALKDKNVERILELVDIAKGLVNYANGKVVIEDGVVSYDGNELHNSLTKRMIRMMQEGFDVEFLVAFMNNLMKNPSHRAVNELYGFLEKNELPITQDGHFLAYKKVREDYKDIHSGKFDNSVGQTPNMPRNMVDEDKNMTCSKGLHFCSKEYLPNFGTGPGNRVMILKINPRDVVSIPTDYNNAKGRCCRYEVIGEWEEGYRNEEEAFEKSVVTDDGAGVRENVRIQQKVPAPDSEKWFDEYSGIWRDGAGRFTSAPAKKTEQSSDIYYDSITGTYRYRDTGRFAPNPNKR